MGTADTNPTLSEEFIIPDEFASTPEEAAAAMEAAGIAQQQGHLHVFEAWRMMVSLKKILKKDGAERAADLSSDAATMSFRVIMEHVRKPKTAGAQRPLPDAVKVQLHQLVPVMVDLPAAENAVFMEFVEALKIYLGMAAEHEVAFGAAVIRLNRLRHQRDEAEGEASQDLDTAIQKIERLLRYYDGGKVYDIISSCRKELTMRMNSPRPHEALLASEFLGPVVMKADEIASGIDTSSVPTPREFRQRERIPRETIIQALNEILALPKV